jgi:hypothetical protein
MADEHGNVLPPAEIGMPEGHPTMTEVRIELEVGERSKMVMTHAGIAADSPGASGWRMALDKARRLRRGAQRSITTVIDGATTAPGRAHASD